MDLRRRTLLTGTVLAGTVAGTAGLVACTPEPRKRTASVSSKQFEHWPTERVQTFRVQPDATLAVTIDLIFDAGGGTDHPVRVTWDTDRQLHRLTDRFIDVRPELVDPAVVHTSAGGAALTLEPEPDEGSLRIWALFGPDGIWAPGRHRLTFTHRTVNTWLDVDGDHRLVLWALGTYPVWTDSGDSYLRIDTEGERWEATSDGDVTPVTDPYAPPEYGADEVTYSFLRPDLSVAPQPAPTRPR